MLVEVIYFRNARSVTNLTDPTPIGDYSLLAGALIRHRRTVFTQSIADPGSGDTFISLLDTPPSYSGQSGRIPAVKSTEDGLEFIDPPVPSAQTRLLTPGSVFWLGTGYDFICTAATYLINGIAFASPDTTFTLDPSDPTNDRIDVIAVDDTGAVVIITGVPGGPPVEPQVDPAHQLRITSIDVDAASTEPSVTNEELYLENTEWTSATNSPGTINLASTNNPHTGTKCIEATAAANNNRFDLTKPSGDVSLDDFTLLVFYIRSKASWASPKSISIFWMNGVTNVGTSVALKHGQFNFDSSQTSAYQLIAIPTSLFNTAGAPVTKLRAVVSGGGGTIGWYIDDIVLQAGVIIPTGVSKFTDLSDVPPSYAGQGLKAVRVKATETGLEFFIIPAGITTFLGLTDTPDSYSGQGGKLVAIKVDESGLEFVPVPTSLPENVRLAGPFFGKKKTSGLATGVLDFTALMHYAGTIEGAWGRVDSGTITFKFRKKAYGSAGTSDPGTGDRINTSGLSLSSTGTTMFGTSDFTTLDVDADDILLAEITALTGTPTSFECGLILRKTD